MKTLSVIVACLFIATLAMWQLGRHRSYYYRIDGWGVYGIGSGGFLYAPHGEFARTFRIGYSSNAFTWPTSQFEFGPVHRIDRFGNHFLAIWPVTTFFYAATVVLVLRAFKPRPRPGACSACGYPLQGISSNRCPECGAPFIQNSGAAHVSP